jgi:hypothetical protein
MPIYLVRWPGLAAALVSAANEDELLTTLDETENPEGCTWSVYRGPINIEFTLNAEIEIDEAEGLRGRPLEPGQVRVGDVSRICRRELLTAGIAPDADISDEMVNTIMRKAFPELHAVVETAGEELPEEQVRAALGAELELLVKASWQTEQTKRRPDQASKVAAAMGTAPRLVTHWAKQAAEQHARAAKPSPPKKPSPPRGRRKPPKKESR